MKLLHRFSVFQVLNQRIEDENPASFMTLQHFFGVAKAEVRPDDFAKSKLVFREQLALIQSYDIVAFMPPHLAEEYIDQAATVTMLFVSYDLLFSDGSVNEVKLEEYNTLIRPLYRDASTRILKRSSALPSFRAVDIDGLDNDQMTPLLFDYIFARTGFPRLNEGRIVSSLASLEQKMRPYLCYSQDLIRYLGSRVRAKTHGDVSYVLRENRKKDGSSYFQTFLYGFQGTDYSISLHFPDN